jgi:hypothetical protein
VSDPNPSVVTALAELEHVLATRGEPSVEEEERRGRPLPEGWKDDPVKVLIAMVLAQPDHEGVARALGWFYGRGLSDAEAASPGAGVMDVGALVLEVLQRAVASDGLETVRRRFDEAFGEDDGG